MRDGNAGVMTGSALERTLTITLAEMVEYEALQCPVLKLYLNPQFESKCPETFLSRETWEHGRR